MNNWDSPPSSIDTAASCSVEVRQARFSVFEIGYVIGFKKYGIWLNCSASLNSTFQLVIQLHSAEYGAAQVNMFNIMNLVLAKEWFMQT